MNWKCLLVVLVAFVAVLMFGPSAGVSVAADKEIVPPAPAQVAPQPGMGSGAAATEKTASTKVNINTAGAADLQKLTGIGPKIAEEIVKYREVNGLFQKTEDLKKVKGIGDKKFEVVKDQITVE